MNLYILIFGLVILNIIHLASAVVKVRNHLIMVLGRPLYFTIYATVSTVGLLLIIFAYWQRELIEIYAVSEWAIIVNRQVMLLAIWLLVSQFFNGYIKKFSKVPLLIAIIIWAFGHLLANGDLYSVVLFSGFLIYGLLAVYFKFKNEIIAHDYHYKNDIRAFFIGFIAYLVIGYLHYTIAGINVLI